MSKRIAIVGGGYLGADLAKSLDDVADITLIEPHSHFVHAPAMIRAVVDPSLLDRAVYVRLKGNWRNGRCNRLPKAWPRNARKSWARQLRWT